MKFLWIVIVAIFVGAFCDSSPAINEEVVQTVNAIQSQWTAGFPKRFEGMTKDDVKGLLGTILKGESGYLELEPKKFVLKDTPSSFDSRDAWPECADLIGSPRDQSSCGSCWAFSSTESLNDRLCMKTGDTTLLSADDTLSCCTGAVCGFSLGCNGGQPAGAWRWFTKSGVVTGGLYESEDSGETCKPYPFPSCAHHVDSEDLPSCDDYDFKTPTCTSTCDSASYGTDYKDDKHLAKTSYSVKTVAEIEQELVENGPVSAAFTVYEDFLSYTGGVYQHVSGKSEGGHAVKIIGYGEDNGTPYWTVVNSWNDTWGEDGLFRILKGQNECGIENSIVAGEV